VEVESAAALLAATVTSLQARAPAIVAAAAHELEGIVLGLHFGDGSHAELRPEQSRLLATTEPTSPPDVEVYFDDRSLNLLFDLERRAVDQLAPHSLDVRGSREQVLAVWRTFQLLSQRSSGLRHVQALWRSYRDRTPERWASEPKPALLASPSAEQRVAQRDAGASREVGWAALDYLDRRHPEDLDVPEGVVGGTIRMPSRALWNGRDSQSWWALPGAFDADLLATLASCKARVKRELENMIPDREPRVDLYDLMRDYPTREGKGLRPTLTLATCAALGGRADDAARTAAAIELFHNGFLVHDDIADESTHRRGLATLHEAHGVGLAVNTGDAMNLMAVDAVLSNLPTLGLARTLGLIHEIMHMCRETVEGQAVELGWIRRQEVPCHDEDYFGMSTKKTGWYTCISPCRLGAVCAGETKPERLDSFNEAFRLIGIAFQIQDDVLNLIGDETLYGKEGLGDLLEGKRTVMLIHLFRNADEKRRTRLRQLLAGGRCDRSMDQAREMLSAMREAGSIEYAVNLADRLAHEGVRRFEEDLKWIPENEAKAILRQVANYVTTRPL
jgi:geranylgeranyl diphosphate synthase type II